MDEYIEFDRNIPFDEGVLSVYKIPNVHTGRDLTLIKGQVGGSFYIAQGSDEDQLLGELEKLFS